MLILPGNQSSQYQIARSLRFNSADSAYLSRTFSTPTNAKIWSCSFWVKRAALGSGEHTIIAKNGSAYSRVSFSNSGAGLGDDVFSYYDGDGGKAYITTAVYRDPTAWYHFVVAYDNTQGIAANRCRIYVNGTEFSVTSTITNNYAGDFNTAADHAIGRQAFAGTYLSAYLSEVIFVDGQQLTASSFGETNTTTGSWNPKRYTGTYGTNGFKLNFSDNSNTTAATLGADSSGNGNNWTPNNFSVTAGSGNDSLTDTPTNYGSGTSGGDVRGNFCTLNNITRGNSNITVSNGGLDVTGTTTWDRGITGLFPVGSGKWYFEYTHGTVGGGQAPADIGWTKYQGLIDSSSNGGSASTSTYLVRSDNGNKNNGSDGGSYGSAFATSDVEMVALDLDNGEIYWGKAGTWFNSGNPATRTNPAFTGLSGLFVPAWYWGLSSGTGGASGVMNFGQRAYAHTPPSGFKSLCTQNITNSAVQKPSTAFATNLRTGTGSTVNVTGIAFSPSLSWTKSRSAATDHALYDSVRGVEKRLESNNSDAEVTGDTTGLTAFNSDGVTFGALAQVNTNTATYVDWFWREGATYGFDIVTYTGTGSAHTESHNLGATPSFMVVKCRSAANDWAVYHVSQAATPQNNYMLLNSTAATASDSTYWNNTAPTSSVFSIGTNADVNTNTATYVAYLWAPVAGFSSFGSYTGNASTDGPVLAMGLSPAWLLYKPSTFASDWFIKDNLRPGYNENIPYIFVNAANAEVAGTAGNDSFDFLAAGAKVRGSNAGVNYSGHTFITAAFAAQNFKNARAA